MQLGILEAKTRFSELVDRAAKGEEIIITKRGAVVAKLAPAGRGMTDEQSAAWLKRVQERRKSMKPSTWEETKKLVHEGHKY